VTRQLASVYRDWPARTTETNPHPKLITRSVGRAKNTSPRPFAIALGRLRRHLIKQPGRYVA